MRADKLFYLILTCILAVSCGGKSGGGGSGSTTPQTEEGGPTGSTGNLGVTYDTELSSAERKALDSSTQALQDYQIDGSKIKYFSQIFGGNNSSNVASYFDTRVNYALSASTDLNSRLVTNTASMNQLLEYFALNPSTPLWYLAKANEPTNVSFMINNKPVAITSSRIGIMQFGDLYVNSPASVQASTLVHEARHSDCTGGATRADIERTKNGQPVQNHECGHLHDICPPGHSNAGVAACDALPWGAYIIDAIYSAAIISACSNCSETDKQAAEINFNDVIQRQLYDVEDLLNGVFGPPDMSSSNQVR